MKDLIFNLIWSAILAWCLTKLMVYVDGKFAISSMYFFPSIIDFIHGFDLSVKVVFFLISTGFFMLGLSKFIGNLILWIIGAIFWFIVIGGGLFLIYKFLSWMIGTL